MGSAEKQHTDSCLEVLNMQMLGQAGCGKSYCLGAMSKLANDVISSVSIADKELANEAIKLCGARGITPYGAV